jgi:hypothetical protein
MASSAAANETSGTVAAGKGAGLWGSEMAFASGAVRTAEILALTEAPGVVAEVSGRSSAGEVVLCRLAVPSGRVADDVSSGAASFNSSSSTFGFAAAPGVSSGMVGGGMDSVADGSEGGGSWPVDLRGRAVRLGVFLCLSPDGVGVICLTFDLMDSRCLQQTLTGSLPKAKGNIFWMQTAAARPPVAADVRRFPINNCR